MRRKPKTVKSYEQKGELSIVSNFQKKLIFLKLFFLSLMFHVSCNACLCLQKNMIWEKAFALMLCFQIIVSCLLILYCMLG